MKTVKKLCTPAYVYLVISVISIVILMFQNAGNKNIFCLGSYECDVPSTGVVFVVQVLYTMFWVFVLNAICSAGYEKVSWFLVLLPYLFLFIALGMLLLGRPVREGLVSEPKPREPRKVRKDKRGVVMDEVCTSVKDQTACLGKDGKCRWVDGGCQVISSSAGDILSDTSKLKLRSGQ
jgi:hypothetical protein